MTLPTCNPMVIKQIKTSDAEAAITRYQTILADAEVSSDLQQRALQVIVALGGEPDLDGVVTQGHDGAAMDN